MFPINVTSNHSMLNSTSLSCHSVVFALVETVSAEQINAIVNEEDATLFCHGVYNRLLVKRLTDTILVALKPYVTAVFVLKPYDNVVGLEGVNVVSRLSELAYKVFFSFSASYLASGLVTSYGLISIKEFLLSPNFRLLSYPMVSHYSVQREHGVLQPAVTSIFLIDLIQDFEILKPLLLRAALPFSPLRPIVAISNRVVKYGSYLIQAIMSFVETFNIPWFQPNDALDVAHALGNQRALLITASESNAAGHIMCHKSCLIAPPKTIRITIQHGYECVGLRHHRAHDYSYKSDPIRFASDVVLTWAHPDLLPNLHPLEQHKCIPVGIVKQLAEEAAVVNEWDWPDALPSQHRQSRPLQLLLAENLHSVRFSSPGKFHRLLAFINEANQSESVNLTIRSHPAKRTLESNPKKRQEYTFLEGTLTASILKSFDIMISPPSTIVLDSVITGTKTLIWSDESAFGDCMNYHGLSSIADFSDLSLMLDQNRFHHCAKNYAWALHNSSALNGIPAAWNAIINLIR